MLKSLSLMDEREKTATITEKDNWQSYLVRSICEIGMFTALMCVLSPLSIPIGPVPITLATLILYIVGAVFDWKISCSIVAFYLLLGTIGLPVFSSFQGGFQVILGPTGGFLIGYLPCVFLISFFIKKWPNEKWLYPLMMASGTIVLYSIGTFWLIIYSNYDISKALMVAVVPFLFGDSLKITLASALSIRVRPLLNRLH